MTDLKPDPVRVRQEFVMSQADRVAPRMQIA
jgi:hypothetical protein